MKVKAAAKINLMLDIVKRLDNGYHSLWMIMQSVGLYDIVSVEKTESKRIQLECDDVSLPCNEKNIAYKATKAFFNYTNIENTGVRIKIEKNIPLAAGLAGGSVDGAAVIFILDKIFDTRLTQNQMCEIGVKVGADVPFALTGGTSLALNIGEILAPLPELEKCFIVLAKPEQGVSTENAYSLYDKKDSVRHPDKVNMLEALSTGNFDRAYSYIENVFEQAIYVHERPYIKSIMRKFGCKACCMSGSGPTVFGIFEDEKSANDCLSELKKKMKDVFVTVPVKESIEIIE